MAANNRLPALGLINCRLPRTHALRFIPLVARRNATHTRQPGMTLEKPDKFRPPSHPSRLVKKSTPRQYPGPPLSAEEVEAMKTKRYPNMFPQEGTKLHWFLTHRLVHVYIAVTILFGLGGYVFIADFQKYNKFPDLLPPSSLFWSGHPLQYLSQYISVYKMSVEARSAEVAEKRRKNIEDAGKRKQFLKEHGLWKDKWFLGEDPTPEERAEELKSRKGTPSTANTAATVAAAEGDSTMIHAVSGQGAYRDFEGNESKAKKWFGIW